jgi:hypothetical protein
MIFAEHFWSASVAYPILGEVKRSTRNRRRSGNDPKDASSDPALSSAIVAFDHPLRAESTKRLIPAFSTAAELAASDVRGRFAEAVSAWLVRSPSPSTRSNYARDLEQFLAFIGVPATHLHQLPTIRPHHVAAWRDTLKQ